MTGLRDHAKKAETEVRTVSNAEGHTYRIESDELLEADEIGDDEFPQYGQWLETTDRPEGTKTVYLETPAVLAKRLVDEVAHNADLEGRLFTLTDAEKVDGRWEVDLEVHDAGTEWSDLEDPARFM